MSALLTTTMLEMKETIDLLKEEGLKDSVKVIVGGARLPRILLKRSAPTAGRPMPLAKDLAQTLAENDLQALTRV